MDLLKRGRLKIGGSVWRTSLFIIGGHLEKLWSVDLDSCLFACFWRKALIGGSREWCVDKTIGSGEAWKLMDIYSFRLVGVLVYIPRIICVSYYETLYMVEAYRAWDRWKWWKHTIFDLASVGAWKTLLLDLASVESLRSVGVLGQHHNRCF